MRLSRLLGVASAVTILTGVTAAPAWAAPPVNDTVDNAVPVTVGYADTLNTSEATTDAVDAQLNETCGAPATDASVWYLLEPAVDTAVIIDVSRSNYPAGVAVGVGSPGALTTVACGPGTILLTASAGVTYYVLAFDDQSDGGGNGGRLRIAFIETESPSVSLAVSRKAFINSQGNVELHGTYRCENAFGVEISGSVSQAEGPRGASADFLTLELGGCDGTRQEWEATARAFGANFRTGNALVTSFGFSCGGFLCTEGFGERVIKLRPAPAGG